MKYRTVVQETYAEPASGGKLGQHILARDSRILMLCRQRLKQCGGFARKRRVRNVTSRQVDDVGQDFHVKLAAVLLFKHPPARQKRPEILVFRRLAYRYDVKEVSKTSIKFLKHAQGFVRRLCDDADVTPLDIGF